MLSLFTRIGPASAPVTAIEPAVDPLRRVPVRFFHELCWLDSDQFDAGWNAGSTGGGCEPWRSRAYWHGWRNGRVHVGYMQPDAAWKCLREQAQKFEYFRGGDWMHDSEGEENYRRKS